MKRPMLVFSITAIMCSALFLIFKTVSLVWICAAAASVLIFYSVRKTGLRKYIIIPAVCCFALVTAAFLLAFNTFQLKKAEKYEGENLTVYARIESIAETSYKTEYTLRTLTINGKEAKFKLNLTETGSRRFELYDCIVLEETTLAIPLNPDYSEDTAFYSEGIYLTVAKSKQARFVYECDKDPIYYCLKFKEACTEKIGLYLNPQQEGGLLRGMIFGDKSSLDRSIKDNFNKSGISHLLAVSGLHTSLWCGLLIALLSLFKASEKLKAAFCTVFLVLFCIISGFTASVMRASFMTVCSLLAPLFLRQADSLNSLGLAATLITLKNPYSIISPGFVLSVCATAGVIFANGIENAVLPTTYRIKPFALAGIGRFILSGLIVSAAAGIFTLPASACFFGVFSIISPLANLAAVQPAFYAMIIGAIAAAISFLPFAAAKYAASLVFSISKLILKYLIDITSFFSRLKYASLPADKTAIFTCAAVIALFCAAAFFILKFKKSRTVMPIVCILNAITLVLSLMLPLTTVFSPCRLTVLSSENCVCAALAEGTHFAFFGSSTRSADTFSFLPLTAGQTLDLFVAPEAIADCTETVNTIRKTYFPEKTVILSDVNNALSENGGIIPDDSAPKNEKICFADKISIQIIDTQGINCAIIRGKEKTVLMLFSQSAGLEEVQTRLGIKPDIAVIPQNQALNYDGFCDTLIICAGTASDCTADLKRHCKTLLLTEYGSVTVKI